MWYGVSGRDSTFVVWQQHPLGGRATLVPTWHSTLTSGSTCHTPDTASAGRLNEVRGWCVLNHQFGDLERRRAPPRNTHSLPIEMT